MNTESKPLDGKIPEEFLKLCIEAARETTPSFWFNEDSAKQAAIAAYRHLSQSLGGPSEFPAQPDILSILQWAVKNNLHKEGQYWRIDYSSIAYTDQTIVKEINPSVPDDKDEWISVETPPETTEPAMWYNDDNVREVMFENDHATVLAYDTEHGIYKAEYDKMGKWSEVSTNSIRRAKPTHWCPLPAAPINPE